MIGVRSWHIRSPPHHERQLREFAKANNLDEDAIAESSEGVQRSRSPARRAAALRALSCGSSPGKEIRPCGAMRDARLVQL